MEDRPPSPELQERRWRAADLFAAGRTQAEVARLLGVSRVTALRWHRAWAVGGRDALQLSPHRGRPPKLGREEIALVLRTLGQEGPRVPGSRRWTLEEISRRVQERTGVHYHAGHLGRILREMDWPLPLAVSPACVEFLLFADFDGNRLRLFGHHATSSAPRANAPSA